MGCSFGKRHILYFISYFGSIIAILNCPRWTYCISQTELQREYILKRDVSSEITATSHETHVLLHNFSFALNVNPTNYRCSDNITKWLCTPRRNQQLRHRIDTHSIIYSRQETNLCNYWRWTMLFSLLLLRCWNAMYVSRFTGTTIPYPWKYLSIRFLVSVIACMSTYVPAQVVVVMRWIKTTSECLNDNAIKVCK